MTHESWPLTCFDEEAALRRLYAAPDDLASAAEPIANFPLPWYERFLQEVKRLGIEVITYRNLFEHSTDWDYRSGYAAELRQWKRRARPEKVYLLIQHDVDNHPLFTKRMVAMEHVYGVRSNIFIFDERYCANGSDVAYDIDHVFFKEAERRGFVIGYHQNAFALAGFDLDAAVDRYRRDVQALRRRYRIEFVVPHGGVGRTISGRKVHNADVPMPAEFEGNLRWVYNHYGMTFSRRWSDGGLRKTRDPQRIAGFDLIRFLHELQPGTRNFCLIHPQRWGYNVDPDQNPMLAEQPWYREVCRQYGRLAAPASSD